MKRTPSWDCPPCCRWLVRWVVVATLANGISLAQEMKMQLFSTVYDVYLSDSTKPQPLYTWTKASMVACAVRCAEHSCCISLFISVNQGSDDLCNCSFYDVHFEDNLLTANDEYRYMYKTPLQGNVQYHILINKYRIYVTCKLSFRLGMKPNTIQTTIVSHFGLIIFLFIIVIFLIVHTKRSTRNIVT